MENSSLYPITFTPIFKERLWGGNKLKSLLHKQITTENVGESWEISAVAGDVSVVSNGSLKGKTLQELINTYKQELLGTRVYNRFKTTFPILIKFIDARLDLSIQLHPDDTLAQKRHNSFGKTEMWYIMQADEDARLIVGFNKTVTKQEYLKNLENKTLTTILNYEKVNPGDTYFIEPGTVHAIGSGILLAEIQQTSDITYRIYDFDRRDKNGKLRELHTDLALDAINYTNNQNFKVTYKQEINTSNNMVTSPYFITNYLPVIGEINYNLQDRDSFTIYMCVKGSATIKSISGSVELSVGQTVLIPAALPNITIEAKKATLLEVYI